MGAGLKTDTDRDPTLIHFAARPANVETVSLLTVFRISLPSIDYLSPDGFTIPQLIDRRTESWESSRAEDFEYTAAQLLESLILQDMDDEEFHDALDDVATTQDIFEEDVEYVDPMELSAHFTTPQTVKAA